MKRKMISGKAVFSIVGAAFLGLCAAWAQGQTVESSIGYVYPAGGQQGTVVHVTVGGQNLRGAAKAYITGEGVIAENVVHIPVLDALQRQTLQEKVSELQRKHRGLPPVERTAPAGQEKAKQDKDAQKDKPSSEPEKPAEPEKPVTFPPHPLLQRLDDLNPEELKKVVEIFLAPLRRQQIKRSIREMVLIDIRIDADARPGSRELRLWTPRGLTNPLCFQVGTAPEMLENEPNDSFANVKTPCDLPVMFNGQILPGDTDLLRFRARQGQSLAIEAQARQIIPYMADAVPGWFQAVLTLYDANGRELAYVDDYRFNPDPVIFFKVPEDGEYIIGIRDSIYRGREDFVYRLYVGGKPFITSVFPLGGRSGTRPVVSIDGWNLPVKSLLIDTGPGGEYIRQTELFKDGTCSNTVSYAVDSLPEFVEDESNDTLRTAQKVALPQTINGRIAKPGDVDIFRFDCPAGYEFAAEVYARRLGSPLDSLLRLTDASGNVLAWNDDNEDKSTGLNTHHADSWFCFTIPKEGTYFVQISDAQGHGGDEYGYRLRVSPRRPDFALRAVPSSLNMTAGSAVPIWIHAIRRDGFNGGIELALRDAPAGFTIGGGRVPAGKDRVRITLTAPAPAPEEPVQLHIEGSAVIDGQTVIRPVVPAEEMMEAFLPLHLVPEQVLLASVMRANYRSAPISLVDDRTLINIPAGGTAPVVARIPQRMFQEMPVLELKDPPAGLSIGDVKMENGLLSFVIRTNGKEAEAGLSDNLIVEVFTNSPVGQPDEKGVRAVKKVSRGFLPAIAIEITGKGN